MKLKLDLHVHTTYSGDSIVTLEAAVQAALESELDGIAVTDHDSYEAVKKLKKLENPGIIIIPGVEVSSAQGHILALGVREAPPPGLPAAETVQEIKRLGGVAVAAHPFCPFKKSLGEETIRAVRFDALEVLNASTIPIVYGSELRKLMRLSKELGLPQTGGSDSHTPETIGRAYTVVEADEPNVEAILEAIKAGKCRVEGSRISLHEALGRLWMKAKSKISI